MQSQLLLFHNAVAAYFSGNQTALEATMKQFSIKVALNEIAPQNSKSKSKCRLNHQIISLPHGQMVRDSRDRKHCDARCNQGHFKCVYNSLSVCIEKSITALLRGNKYLSTSSSL